MEWASGVGVRGYDQQGVLSRPDGTIEIVPLSDLYIRGIPGPSRKKLSVKTSLAEWRPCASAEYPRTLGFPSEIANTSRHQVFEFTSDEQRVLVPALALVRTIFRPKGLIFPFMFKPQVLDRICHLEAGEGPPKLVMNAPWPKSNSRKHPDCSRVLSWMRSFPSATAMAASVHEYARVGAIGMSLPKAEANLILSGKHIGSTFLADDILIKSLTAAEPACHGATSHVQLIAYSSMGNSLVKDSDIPFHEDGSVDLTDDEWTLIEPLIVPPCRRARRHDPRLLLNGVLRKLALGIHWDRMTYAVGNRENATFAYRNWRMRGTYALIVNVLKSSRGPKMPDAP